MREQFPKIAHIGWLASCHLRRRVRELAQRGCADVLYTDQIPDYIDPNSENYSISVLPQKLRKSPMDLLEWLNQDLSRRQIDIVHSHSTHFPASLGFFCSNVIRINSIWDFVYSKDPLSPIHHRAVLESLKQGRLAEAVSFSSPVIRAQWLDEGYPQEKAFMHSWGVDFRKFNNRGQELVASLRQSLGIKEEEHVILSSRTTSLPANLDILIKAVTQLQERFPVRLVIIGGSVTREFRYIEDLLQNDSIRKSIIFPGSITDDSTLSTYYKMSSVVVSLHSNDHNPATILESLALKKPVVACDSPTVAYWVRDNITGFVVPERDTEATAQALAKALTMSEKQKATMGKQGRQLILDEADFLKTIKKVCNNYKNISTITPSMEPDAYALGLLMDMNCANEQALTFYRQAKAEGDSYAPFLNDLICEKKALSAKSFNKNYFCTKRSQGALITTAHLPERFWDEMVKKLDPPKSLFLHDYVAALGPLLQKNLSGFLKLLYLLAARFEYSPRILFAEAVQWFGAILGDWNSCSNLLIKLNEDGGSSLAIHALACAHMQSENPSLRKKLLNKALQWSETPIFDVDQNLDNTFREKVHNEAKLMLEKKLTGLATSIIEESRVYTTTDRMSAFVARRILPKAYGK